MTDEEIRKINATLEELLTSVKISMHQTQNAGEALGKIAIGIDADGHVLDRDEMRAIAEHAIKANALLAEEIVS